MNEAQEFGDHTTNESQFGFVPGGERAAIGELKPINTPPPLAEICAALKELQAQRRFCIRLQSKCDRATEAFIARALGYHSGLPEKERKKLFDAAMKLRRQVERGDEDQEGSGLHAASVRGAVAPLILVAAQGRLGFDRYRKEIEKAMRQLARQLPVWPMVEPIAGFSDLGLAVIVGEAGRDLAAYGGVAKLWKRLGLAVFGEVRQGGLPPSASAAEWIQHGYNRERRAELWVIGDRLLFQQRRRPDKAAPSFAVGPYGEEYGRKKAEYLARGWTPLHAHNAARRYMTKALVRDLWGLWRRFRADQEVENDLAAD